MVSMSKITMNEISLRYFISFCHALTFKKAIKGAVRPKIAKIEENQ
ncbi:hypothetical protein [Enterococcus mediterraneensis]|nr:hypothetical protein [Enterococcus mediterraneensis]